MVSSHLQVHFLIVFLREVVDAAPRYLVSTNSNRSSSMLSDFTGIFIAGAMVDMLSGEGDKNIAFRGSCSALLCSLFILCCRFPARWFPIYDLAPLDLVIGIQEARILWFHQSLSPLDSYLLIKTHLCFFKVTVSIRIVFRLVSRIEWIIVVSIYLSFHNSHSFPTAGEVMKPEWNGARIKQCEAETGQFLF